MRGKSKKHKQAKRKNFFNSVRHGVIADSLWACQGESMQYGRSVLVLLRRSLWDGHFGLRSLYVGRSGSGSLWVGCSKTVETITVCILHLCALHPEYMHAPSMCLFFYLYISTMYTHSILYMFQHVWSYVCSYTPQCIKTFHHLYNPPCVCSFPVYILPLPA